jgi:hypothetical protein
MKIISLISISGTISLVSLAVCVAGETPTNSVATFVKRLATSPRQMVIVHDRSGKTNSVNCNLLDEIHSVQSPAERAKGTSHTQTKVTLITDDDGKHAIWSYWPPNTPLSYDFKIATAPEGSIIVFAKNYSVGVFDRIVMNDSTASPYEFVNPEPEFIDLGKMLGDEAFAPDRGIIMNALTRNLKIEDVRYDGRWHITVRGKGGKTYTIIRNGKTWVLE